MFLWTWLSVYKQNSLFTYFTDMTDCQIYLRIATQGFSTKLEKNFMMKVMSKKIKP